MLIIYLPTPIGGRLGTWSLTGTPRGCARVGRRCSERCRHCAITEWSLGSAHGRCRPGRLMESTIRSRVATAASRVARARLHRHALTNAPHERWRVVAPDIGATVSMSFTHQYPPEPHGHVGHSCPGPQKARSDQPRRGRAFPTRCSALSDEAASVKRLEALEHRCLHHKTGEHRGRARLARWTTSGPLRVSHP